MKRLISLILLLAVFTAPAVAQFNGGQLLPLYGSWTPTDASGTGPGLTGVSGSYIKIGKQVTVYGALTYLSTVDGANALIGGLPFSSSTSGALGGCYATYSNIVALARGNVTMNAVTLQFSTSGGSVIPNSAMSGGQIIFTCSYLTP